MSTICHSVIEKATGGRVKSDFDPVPEKKKKKKREADSALPAFPAASARKDGFLIREDSHNYRKHGVANLAMIDRSLRENGAGRSILLDNTGMSIAGSGTLKSAKRRGIPIREIHTDGSELIAIVRDDISPDDPKRKRLALADNAASDSSDWDFDALAQDEWSAEDLSEWGVEVPQEEPQEEKKDDAHVPKEYRERTFKINHFDWFLEIPPEDLTRDGFPKLRAVDVLPERAEAVSFHNMRKGKMLDLGIHFFADDYKFECVWNEPERYFRELSRHPYIVQADFSLYTDMPLVMQKWNCYRNFLLAWYWQNMVGLTVVPCLLWLDEPSFEWCFDAIPQNSTVCVSSVGCMGNPEWKAAFIKGLRAGIERTKPTRILFYGTMPDFDFGGVEVVNIKANVMQ